MDGEVAVDVEVCRFVPRSFRYGVLRLKGWMLLRDGRSEEAERPVQAAIDWSRHQQARSWELRASTTLAELCLMDGRRDDARELLAPIYGFSSDAGRHAETGAPSRVSGA